LASLLELQVLEEQLGHAAFLLVVLRVHPKPHRNPPGPMLPVPHTKCSMVCLASGYGTAGVGSFLVEQYGHARSV